MRVALMARVSSEEQARHGISINVQLDDLREWAKQNGHTIVGEYVDAGVSGRKPYTKRPELLRFVQELEGGLQVDALVFTRLDRFFRSVKHYYQIMPILEAHHVGWIAIQEDYETMTSQGQFVVNLMLSIAEAEAARTGEKIKSVLDNKVKHGEAICGSAKQPIGYKVEGKKIVTDERADDIKAIYDYFERTGSLHGTMDYAHDELGLPICISTVSRILSKQCYTGVYRDNPNFYPQIITPEQFERVQKMKSRRSVRKNQSNRVYIFSGLVRCGVCGCSMKGNTSGGCKKNYRCGKAVTNHLCTNRRSISEKRLEEWLIANVETQYGGFVQAHQTPKVKKKKVDTAAIEKKLERLKDLYVDGLITKAQYKADYDKLQALRADNAPIAPDYEKVRKIIKENLTAEYQKLTPENKRVLWRSIIDYIAIDADKNIELFFKE